MAEIGSRWRIVEMHPARSRAFANYTKATEDPSTGKENCFDANGKLVQ